MATLVGGTDFTGEITLAKRIGTLLTLQTERTYVDRDVQFTLNVQSGAGAANTASADASVESTSGTAGGTNISGAIGTKSATEPTSGYYIRINATGSGSSQVTTAGWLDTGAMGTASTNKTVYFPIAEATASFSGTNTVTPTASVSGSNVTLSNTDNGISISATGGGTASATASVVSQTAGYVPSGSTVGSGTVNASSSTTVASSYISGVNLEAPVSGTRSFSVTVPKGDSTQTVTFTVDSNGNVLVD